MAYIKKKLYKVARCIDKKIDWIRITKIKFAQKWLR